MTIKSDLLTANLEELLDAAVAAVEAGSAANAANVNNAIKAIAKSLLLISWFSPG